MKEKRFIQKMLLLVLVGLLFVAYGRYVEKEVIESANLIEVSGNGYSIKFNGQVYKYNY